MDRNFIISIDIPPLCVALRKESVDRNRRALKRAITGIKSLSARRAWIEIIMFVNLRVVDGVALRKESVDRNMPSH